MTKTKKSKTLKSVSLKENLILKITKTLQKQQTENKKSHLVKMNLMQIFLKNS